MEETAPRLHVCFVNVTSGIGGVERVAERHLTHLDPARFRLSYAYTPFHGDEAHVARLRAAGVNIVPMENILTLWSRGSSKPVSPAKKSATRFWKKTVPARLDEFVFHMRNVRRLTRVFESALSKIAEPPAIFQLVAGDYFWMAAACRVCRKLFPSAKIKLHLGNPPVFLVPTFLERRAFRDADSVSFVSKDTRNAWEKKLGFTIGHARVIRTPVDTDAIPFVLREKTSADAPFVLLTSGRLSPIKGIDVALRAVRTLRENGFNVVLWIAGTGPEEARLQDLVRELKLTDHVKFLGFVNDLTSIFSKVDFLLQPSTRTEGVPNSVLEAMASGMPVIASRVGGVPELIAHRETGILVDPGKPPQIVDAVAELIRNPDLRTAIARAASEHVRQSYAVSIATASLARLYESMASGKPAAATQAF